MKNSRRTLKSLEGKIGQNNLAASLQVHPSTIRRWKKKNRIPKVYSNKIAAIKEVSKNYRPTRKYKLRNKRAERVSKYQSLTYHPQTETYDIFAEAIPFETIPDILEEWLDLKIKGKPISLVWLTAIGIDRGGEIKIVSTFSFPIEEMMEIWQSELNTLAYEDYSIQQIVTVFVKGISYHGA